MKIKPATDVSTDQLCEAMNDAFSDYVVPMSLSRSQFETMMRQRGLELGASRVAVIDGRIAAIWLVSIRDGQSYLISSGTRPEFRFRGLARTLGHNCLEALRSDGVTSFQLEVIESNTAAISLYEGLGMITARRLDCYAIPKVRLPDDTGVVTAQTDWQTIASEAARLRDWQPTWQNSDLSLSAIADQLICVAVSDGESLLAYGVASPASATLLQIAVQVDRRRRKLASLVLSRLSDGLPEPGLRVLNVQHDDAGFRGFMTHVGATQTIRQLEMVMQL